MKRTLLPIKTLLTVVVACAQLGAQHAQKPLTNDDVIAMVQKKLPESVIVSAIQARPGKFNTSTNDLIRLNAAGVTETELNAMLAASKKSGAPSMPSAASTPADPGPSGSAMPAS